MTQSPPIPRSRRNLSDLDSLIDASIGKSATYGASLSPSQGSERHAKAESPAKDTAPLATPLEAAAEPPPNQPSDGAASDEPRPERFRIGIDASIIMATKMLAVQQKTSPSEIVERALRRYLNLPAVER